MSALAGKTAMITGAANGIGRGCALHLAEHGATIVAIDLDEAGLHGLLTEIGEPGQRAISVAGDCRHDAAAEEAFERAEAAFGAVDILINNVGQSARERAGPFVDSDSETWAFVLDISLFTTLRFSRLAAPAMKERGWGRIINMSSDAALVGDAGLADYAAAKSGVLSFTRSLARELAPHGVTVNAICPGAIRTRALEQLDQDVVRSVERSIPMGRIGEVEDVAALAGFLAGEGGRYVTGQAIAVDGGRWMA